MSRLLMPILLLLASVGLFFTWIDPTYKKVTAHREEVARLNDLNVKATELSNKRNTLVERYGNLNDDDESKLLKLLPDHSDNIQLLIDVNHIAATYGLTLKDIELGDKKAEGKRSQNPDSSTEETLYDEVLLSFSVEGGYPDFVSFLRDVEHNLRLVDVRQLTIETTEIPDRHTFSLSIATYWLK